MDPTTIKKKNKIQEITLKDKGPIKPKVWKQLVCKKSIRGKKPSLQLMRKREKV